MARILLVDDDEVARLAMGTVLEEEGHDITYAPNGEVGLHLYRQRPFTVVLVDLIMPVKNGLQMIREPWNSIKVRGSSRSRASVPKTWIWQRNWERCGCSSSRSHPMIC